MGINQCQQSQNAPDNWTNKYKKEPRKSLMQPGKELIRQAVGYFKIECKSKLLLNEYPFNQQNALKYHGHHQIQCVEDTGMYIETQMFTCEKGNLGDYLCFINKQSKGALNVYNASQGESYQRATSSISKNSLQHKHQAFQFVKSQFEGYYYILNCAHGYVLCENGQNRSAIFVKQSQEKLAKKSFRFVALTDQAQMILNDLVESCVITPNK